MRISGDWARRSETQAVCAALSGGGHRALFVGGCVRNDLLGEAVADVDIATDARPERVIALVAGAGMKAVPTGLAHGTITVVCGDLAHEVTTFRRDVETFGRHATVAFSDDICADAARRDFTMNALYATPEGAVLDPLGEGLADLTARRVRFVGDAGARIAEDYLRILRYFRFHAWYGRQESGLDPVGLAACAAAADGVSTLSRERIGAEMRKLLAAPDPAPAVAAMDGAGVLARVLPGAGAQALATLVQLEKGHTGPWLRRLAVLGGTAEAERLRLSRAEARSLTTLRKAAESQAGAAELGYRHGAALAEDIVLARAAIQPASPPEGWRAEIARGAGVRFPLRTADLARDVSGPELGALLRRLENRWIASDFRLTREELLAGDDRP